VGERPSLHQPLQALLLSSAVILRSAPIGAYGTPAPHLGIEVPNDPDGGPWRTDPCSWSTGHPGDHAAARLVGPVPRDRVTPPCCGRGGVTRSFSCRSASGGDGTGSSTGHTGHRSTAASMVRRRAELARPPLAGQGAASGGLGAATRPSSASVTFPWLIHAPWLIAGAGILPSHRGARIHHNNRRAPPPAVTPVMPCDGCDMRRRAEATPSAPWLRWSADGRAGWWHRWPAPINRSSCATAHSRPGAGGGVRR
jgi:hypothetical protein